MECAAVLILLFVTKYHVLTIYELKYGYIFKVRPALKSVLRFF